MSGGQSVVVFTAGASAQELALPLPSGTPFSTTPSGQAAPDPKRSSTTASYVLLGLFLVSVKLLPTDQCLD